MTDGASPNLTWSKVQAFILAEPQPGTALAAARQKQKQLEQQRQQQPKQNGGVTAEKRMPAKEEKMNVQEKAQQKQQPFSWSAFLLAEPQPGTVVRSGPRTSGTTRHTQESEAAASPSPDRHRDDIVPKLTMESSQETQDSDATSGYYPRDKASEKPASASFLGSSMSTQETFAESSKDSSMESSQSADDDDDEWEMIATATGAAESKESKKHYLHAEFPNLNATEAEGYLHLARWDLRQALQMAKEDAEWNSVPNSPLTSHRRQRVQIHTKLPAIATNSIIAQDAYKAASEHQNFGFELQSFKL